MNRYDAGELERFADSFLRGAGFTEDQARVTAHLLLEADLMGHTTHGLQLCGSYAKKVESKEVRPDGRLEVVSDRGPTGVWDADYLPGLWVTDTAIDGLLEKAAEYGLAALAIRRCGHIGCLQSFLTKATERGHFILLSSSDPSVRLVAPFGGRTPVFTPNPIGIGIPTDDEPILVDTSCSITTLGTIMRNLDAGTQLPGEWLLTHDGISTSDPRVMTASPPGSMLLAGALDHGHKGYGLTLMIEALTQGMSGLGRADGVKEWGAGLFIQIIDPDAFGGRDAFIRQTGWLRNACLESEPLPGGEPVRLPGQAALESKREMTKHGVVLHPVVLESITKWAERAQVEFPSPL